MLLPSYKVSVLYWDKVGSYEKSLLILEVVFGSVVTIPDFAMRYLGHDAIRIAILVYCVSQCLDLQFAYDGNAIYRPRYT